MSVRKLGTSKTKSAEDPLPPILPFQLTTSEGKMNLMLSKNTRLDLNKVNVRLGSGKEYVRKVRNPRIKEIW